MIVKTKWDVIIKFHDKLATEGNPRIKRLRELTDKELEREHRKWADIRDAQTPHYRKLGGFVSSTFVGKGSKPIDDIARRRLALAELVEVKVDTPADRRVEEIFAEMKRRERDGISIKAKEQDTMLEHERVKSEFAKLRKRKKNATVDDLIHKIAESSGKTFEATKGSLYYIPKKKLQK